MTVKELIQWNEVSPSPRGAFRTFSKIFDEAFAKMTPIFKQHCVKSVQKLILE